MIFSVLGLNNEFKVIALFEPSNIQWDRKYHEPGTFSIEIPIDQYNADVKYIYTKDRPEIGLISQLNYVENDGVKKISISGYFLENLLNNMVCYPLGTYDNVKNIPTWSHYSGKAEDTAYAYFNAFKSIKIGTETYELNILPKTSQSRGHISDHARHGEDLGHKIYLILKPSDMSYRVRYNFNDEKMYFDVWTGLDRTQDNTQGNNPIIFSTRYGNLKNPNIVRSTDTFKNSFVVTSTKEEDNKKTVYGSSLGVSPPKFIYVESESNVDDYSTLEEFYTALRTDGHEELIKNTETFNVDFDTIYGNYEYMKDFDLGDKCSIEIPEIPISASAVLIACHEVIKNGVWEMNMEFGTPVFL